MNGDDACVCRRICPRHFSTVTTPMSRAIVGHSHDANVLLVVAMPVLPPSLVRFVPLFQHTWCSPTTGH